MSLSVLVVVLPAAKVVEVVRAVPMHLMLAAVWAVLCSLVGASFAVVEEFCLPLSSVMAVSYRGLLVQVVEADGSHLPALS